MAKTANINIRVDPEVKSTVDGIFSHFGITVADAVNIFLHIDKREVGGDW